MRRKHSKAPERKNALRVFGVFENFQEPVRPIPRGREGMKAVREQDFFKLYKILVTTFEKLIEHMGDHKNFERRP